MINISYRAKTALEILGDHGFEAFVVGGAVRDRLMGDIPGDYDITTNATPDKTVELFSRYKVIETGLRHGTVTVIIDGQPLEITTYRTESAYSDTRHPDSVQFTNSLQEDCARRDFTINAICYNPQLGIRDYYNGENDIKNKVIRCVGDPVQRFEEDALRILRAVRFASVLGFEIEDKTKEAVFSCAHLLKNISAERIYTELQKLLCGKNVKKVLLEYTQVLDVFMPQIMPAKGFDQKNYHHIYDVLEHTAVAVENIPPVPQLRMAALLHDFGKPATFTQDEKGVGHFYNHGEISWQMACDILKKLKVSAEDYQLITTLVRYHDYPVLPNEKSVRRALNKFGEETLRMLLLLKRADNRGQNIADFDRKEEYDALEKVIDDVIRQRQCFSLKHLAVNGTDLIDMGVPPSPQTGYILNALLEMVINDDIPNHKEILLEKAGEIIKNI
ncbi:MAG: HD domain-containing protein [Oscillospiraceae bacterium]|nr:HD domain-containing protein [Oscillospiraceae bacterium]